jgi:hypothetical protein
LARHSLYFPVPLHRFKSKTRRRACPIHTIIIPAARNPYRSHHKPHDLDPIELIDEKEAAEAAAHKIKTYGAETVRHEHGGWKRKPNTNGTGASHVRSFHGKYSDQGLEYLDNAINEWLDSHDDVEVKFVTSTVGVFEGKIREPALVLNLWY